jgi:hypothetical protein
MRDRPQFSLVLAVCTPTSLRLHRHALDDAELGLGWHYRSRLEPRCGEESPKLCLGAFTPAGGHHQHLQIGQDHLRRLCGAFWDHPLHEEQLALPLHRSVAVLQDGDRLGIIPVVDNRFEDVRVATSRHRHKEVPCHDVATLRDALCLDQSPGVVMI